MADYKEPHEESWKVFRFGTSVPIIGTESGGETICLMNGATDQPPTERMLLRAKLIAEAPRNKRQNMKLVAAVEQFREMLETDKQECTASGEKRAASKGQTVLNVFNDVFNPILKRDEEKTP